MVYVKLTVSFLAILDTITSTPPKQLRPKKTSMSFFKGVMKKLQKAVPSVAFSMSITATIISSLNF